LGGIRKKLMPEQKTTVSGKDQNIRYKNEIGVNIPIGAIDKETTLKVYSVKRLPKMGKNLAVKKCFRYWSW
jgi:hypothetical protein